ncbi:heterokaryon incompatibility protein-domain-containing protein, partial [Cercophora newfieldiana]
HMKLVDCATRTLVAAEPHMRYLALSYVWGKGPPESYRYPDLPAKLPPTVDDAITATLGLGLRYIWVDRYCIWQDDPVHKSTQILHMTQIYGNAVATIAAAAGTDPSHGLPGVSTTRSRIFGRQYVGRAGPRLLASGSIHNRHKDAISASVWDTRAWTFQEVTLSTRIFFFSDLEVSF